MKSEENKRKHEKEKIFYEKTAIISGK
jgi:hypothetical protein